VSWSRRRREEQPTEVRARLRCSECFGWDHHTGCDGCPIAAAGFDDVGINRWRDDEFSASQLDIPDGFGIGNRSRTDGDVLELI
jgi:hypothetical protein